MTESLKIYAMLLGGCTITTSLVVEMLGGFLRSLPIRRLPWFTEAYLVLPPWAYLVFGLAGIAISFMLQRWTTGGRGTRSGVVVIAVAVVFMLGGVLALAYPFGDVYLLGEPRPKVG